MTMVVIVLVLELLTVVVNGGSCNDGVDDDGDSGDNEFNNSVIFGCVY